ncbi:MAG: MBL fold metallo-hydrolase [Micavibrio sp.]|nr:MBL fold metallo-hydrolase [Micavibrio sp.]
MSEHGEVIILGCGNSSGVPAIGNRWGACDPNEPKNQRTRSSIYVRAGDTSVVIDTGPDFRAQFNRENISDIDAVLFTHHHSDHTAGLDELRVIRHRTGKNLVPCYANSETFTDLNKRFGYMFGGGNHVLYPPIIETRELGEAHYRHAQNIGELSFTPFSQDHGTCETIGYRFGDFAYSMDILTLDDEAIETLKGIKTWVVDAAAYNQPTNPVHANLETIYRLNEQIGAEKVYLSSLSIAMDYQTLLCELPDGYFPAYDGMKIKFSFI